MRMIKPLPEQSILKKKFNYNPSTGKLYWIKRKGQEAGTVGRQGYRSVTLNNIVYQAHRVIYKWMTGEDPEIIDHIDRDKDNNRWSNLRSVSERDNVLNSPFADEGCVEQMKGGKWRARLTCRPLGIIHKHVGTFTSEVAAREAALKARSEVYYE